jgi:hypothetical protein
MHLISGEEEGFGLLGEYEHFSAQKRDLRLRPRPREQAECDAPSTDRSAESDVARRAPHLHERYIRLLRPGAIQAVWAKKTASQTPEQNPAISNKTSDHRSAPRNRLSILACDRYEPAHSTQTYTSLSAAKPPQKLSEKPPAGDRRQVSLRALRIGKRVGGKHHAPGGILLSRSALNLSWLTTTRV